MLEVEATLLVAGAPQAWQKINALPEPPRGHPRPCAMTA